MAIRTADEASVAGSATDEPNHAGLPVDEEDSSPVDEEGGGSDSDGQGSEEADADNSAWLPEAQGEEGEHGDADVTNEDVDHHWRSRLGQLPWRPPVGPCWNVVPSFHACHYPSLVRTTLNAPHTGIHACALPDLSAR